MTDDKEPTTGGMRSHGPADDAERAPETDLWGAADAEDIQAGYAETGNLSPDEAAEVLFGDEAEEVRSHAHHEEGGEEG